MILVGYATRALRRGGSDPQRAASTFLFADLAGYSALTEEHGDETAAAVAREFARTMRALSRKHGARHVKSMGDGVMIWSSDAAQAVALAAEAVTTARLFRSGSACTPDRRFVAALIGTAARSTSPPGWRTELSPAKR